jgi:hypothetical protein
VAVHDEERTPVAGRGSSEVHSTESTGRVAWVLYNVMCFYAVYGYCPPPPPPPPREVAMVLCISVGIGEGGLIKVSLGV